MSKSITTEYLVTLTTDHSTYTITVPVRSAGMAKVFLPAKVQGPYTRNRPVTVSYHRLGVIVIEAVRHATNDEFAKAQALLEALVGARYLVEDLMLTSYVHKVSITIPADAPVPAATVEVDAPAKPRTFEGAVFRNLENAQEAFFQTCERADWHYDYSDDIHMWRRGKEQMEALKVQAATDPVLQAIYDAWRAYFYTGQAYGTVKAPRPALDAGFAEV